MSDYTQEIRAQQGDPGARRSKRIARSGTRCGTWWRTCTTSIPRPIDVDCGQLEEVDRYILARYGELAQRILRAYEEYDYGTIFQALNAFTTVDLSAFYADVSKDRLYTFAARSRERRSAQTAMYVMADGLTRLMAPILSFTADELWRFLPGAREESVHLALFPGRADARALADRELLERWDEAQRRCASAVLAEIEPLRKNKQIGSSLQAKVVLSATPSRARAARALRARPADAVHRVGGRAAARRRLTARHAEARPRVTIDRASGVKCERCWRYVPKVSSEPAWAGLCERCQDALARTDRMA